MAKEKLKIGLMGSGALFGMFTADAMENMPDAVFYDHSQRFLAARKFEVELGKTQYADPNTRVEDRLVTNVDVRIHFKQTLATKDDIRTTVTVFDMSDLEMETLRFSVKEDMTGNRKVEEVFKHHTRKIIRVIRQLRSHRAQVSAASDLEVDPRQPSKHSTGSGRNIGSTRGPTGL